jgi:hypothetical protein
MEMRRLRGYVNNHPHPTFMPIGGNEMKQLAVLRNSIREQIDTVPYDEPESPPLDELDLDETESSTSAAPSSVIAATIPTDDVVVSSSSSVPQTGGRPSASSSSSSSSSSSPTDETCPYCKKNKSTVKCDKCNTMRSCAACDGKSRLLHHLRCSKK